MTAELMLSRIENGQDGRVAFQNDPNDVASIARTISSFLNGDGGVLFCGVDQNGDLLGIPRAITKRAAQDVELKIKGLITPAALITATLEKIDDKRVLVIEAPAGTDKPYVFDGCVWLRTDASTRPADATTLRALVKGQADSLQRWERRLSPLMTDGDLSKEEVKAMVNAAQDSGRFSFEHIKDLHDVLRQISVWMPEGFTQGADVLFSTSPWRRHPQCRVQWVEFEDTKTGDSYADQKWLQGPMLKICRELFGRLESINKVKARFRPGSLQRDDTLMYSTQALREGIVNALVHRDYASYSGGVKISVYPTRIEIWNSGRLPEGIKAVDLKKDHPSILVNPDITHTFYIAGLMEGIGRGTQKIAAESKALGARSPTWRDSASGVTLTIFAATEVAATEAVELNSRQRSLLEALEMGAEISLAEYSRRNPDISDRQARRELVELVAEGNLRREGRGRATIYRRVRPART